jgi:transcription antitermination factor NusG
MTGQAPESGWAVVMTAPQREEAAEAAIERLGYTTFLPRYQRLLKGVKVGPNGRRIRTRRLGELVSRPLFPTYLFVALVPGGFDSRRIIMVSCVVRIVRHAPIDGLAGAVAPVDPAIVDELRQACEAGIFDQVPPVPGDQVRVTDGDFSGLVGTLVRVDDDGLRARVMLQALFGREAPVDLPASALTLAVRRSDYAVATRAPYRRC